MSNATFMVGGCSGSATPSFSRPIYGHNTTALGVLIRHTLFAVDNGTGVRNLARIMAKTSANKAHILQTHLHNDHRIGLPTNPILFRPGFVESLSSSQHNRPLEDEFNWAFGEDSWPISPAVCKVAHRFNRFDPGEELDFGEVRVSTMLVPHPKQSVIYRIKSRAGDVVIATDIELASTEAQRAVADFICGAALVYLDCQYRDSEYAGEAAICEDLQGAVPRIGWGHSTPSQIGATLALTRELPRRLVLGHHDPERTDKDLCRFEHEVMEQFAPIAARCAMMARKDSIMLTSFAYDSATYDF